MRRVLGILAAGALLGNWFWKAGERNRPARTSEPSPAPVTVTLSTGVRLHGIQTGMLAIKRAHSELIGPSALRLGSIVLDGRWTPLLPILAWVVEHSEGLFVVDTGERSAASDVREYLACDPANRWFFGRNLPMFVHPSEEMAVQMRRLDLPPEQVSRVILTHLHQDHTGGLGFFPEAEFLVDRREHEGHLKRPMGAVRCLWPSFFQPRLVDHQGPALGPFPRTLPLTRAGDLVLLPTPGHSYGHQSVLVRDQAVDYLLAGDLAFSQAQLERSGLQGIAADLVQARETLQRVRRFCADRPVVFLPSHDPDSLGRLAALSFAGSR